MPLGKRGLPVTTLVPDFEENRAFFANRPWIEALYYPHRYALGDVIRRSRVLGEDRWSAAWVVGVGLRSCLLRGSRRRHIPIIKDFDEFPSMIGSFSPARRMYLRMVERLMIGQADGFTCASALLEDTVRALRPGINGRLCRLPVAISENEHVADPELVSRIREANAGRPTLLYVGSMSRFYEDQINEVISLAAELRSRGSNARVRILGGGPDLGYFRAKAERPGVGDTLEFAGHDRREDLASHMEASECPRVPFPLEPVQPFTLPDKSLPLRRRKPPGCDKSHRRGSCALWRQRLVLSRAQCQGLCGMLHGSARHRLPLRQRHPLRNPNLEGAGNALRALAIEPGLAP